MSVVDDEDKVVIPHPLVKVGEGEDDWSEMSGSELDDLKDASDEDDEHDNDDKMNEDTNAETQGRYNLRPR